MELKAFDVDNQYGRKAIALVYRAVESGREAGSLAPFPAAQAGVTETFAERAGRMLAAMGVAEETRWGGTRVDPKLSGRVDTFLNRLLGLALGEQQQLFQYFSDMFDATVNQAQAAGTYDSGIVQLHGREVTVMPVHPPAVLLSCGHAVARSCCIE